MFLLMVVGYVVYKGHLFDDEGARQISVFLLKIVTPVTIVVSYQREFDSNLAGMLAISFPLAVLCHLLPIGAGHLLYRSHVADYRDKRMSLVFSNNGFMALPLLQTLLGSVGVFLGSAHIVVATILIWTYGQYTLTGDKRSISLKMIFLNPGTLAVIVGVVLFVSPVKLPLPVFETLKYISALNTPLAMILCGIFVAQANILSVFKDRSVYAMALLKLVVVPIAVLLLLRFIPVATEIRVALMIAVSCPSATSVVMFANNYKTNYIYCAKVVSATTLLSVLTLPFILALTQIAW